MNSPPPNPESCQGQSARFGGAPIPVSEVSEKRDGLRATVVEKRNRPRATAGDRVSIGGREIAWVFPHLSPLCPLLCMVRTLLHVTGLWAEHRRALLAIP